MDYIELIKSKSNYSEVSEDKTKEAYMLIINGKEIVVYLYKDIEGNYYDYIEYKYIYDMMKSIGKPKDFCDNFICGELAYIIISSRVYGQPKLKKPKELNKINASGSVDFLQNRCKCQYFILENDVYIKHRDFFSRSYCEPGDEGTPLNYRLNKYGMKSKNEKFIYADNWGDIVLRNEAWIKIEGLVNTVKIMNPYEVSNRIIKLMEAKHGKLDRTWNIFYESLCKDIRGKTNE